MEPGVCPAGPRGGSPYREGSGPQSETPLPHTHTHTQAFTHANIRHTRLKAALFRWPYEVQPCATQWWKHCIRLLATLFKGIQAAETPLVLFLAFCLLLSSTFCCCFFALFVATQSPLYFIAISLAAPTPTNPAHWLRNTTIKQTNAIALVLHYLTGFFYIYIFQAFLELLGIMRTTQPLFACESFGRSCKITGVLPVKRRWKLEDGESVRDLWSCFSRRRTNNSCGFCARHSAALDARSCCFHVEEDKRPPGRAETQMGAPPEHTEAH